VDDVCWSGDEVRNPWDIVGCNKGCWDVCDESSQSLMLPTLVEEQVIECAVVLT
jgi:hypothetical protein